ncbi:YbhB/YbcL family Raf kinase inhibitor-like protein [Hymenobacter sp. BT664]|uniref:YbhB/YbcL family Raf kinase inhibitor-like protein n=1 Tax=Hymenobacter montanus TaxID=2771359 RepID=A0A927BB12_9BACT|nr:YbhB/YbcL family Raf kinase inhibitor-like protein [Hymenobacter montanus]MBD2767422.1 YbhB/YbcL family Raf kinase inhibitor-like protein [Hymenobacter montanus]
MKRFSFLLGLGLLAAGGHAQTFTLKSSELGGQATARQFLNGNGCSGGNVSPQLSWEHAPKGTQSFAVTMYDKDAPTGSGWWHWVVFNIPPSTTELKAGAGEVAKALAPAGCVQSVTDFGKPGYGGPCPPPGPPHQYLITVYALNTKLDLDKTATPALVGFYLGQAALAQASLVVYGKR